MYNSDRSAFIKAYKEGDASVLLKVLEPTVKKITNSTFKKGKVQDLIIIGRDDIAQEIRLFLWEKLPKIIVMENITPGEAYKYTTTLMKRRAIRYVMEIRYTNPRLKAKRKIKEKCINISKINLEFFDFKASYPIDSLIELFKNRCKTIKNAEKIFYFLTTEDDIEEFAGLNPNIYFNVVSKMKELAKDIATEVPYE